MWDPLPPKLQGQNILKSCKEEEDGEQGGGGGGQGSMAIQN